MLAEIEDLPLIEMPRFRFPTTRTVIYSIFYIQGSQSEITTLTIKKSAEIEI